VHLLCLGAERANVKKGVGFLSTGSSPQASDPLLCVGTSDPFGTVLFFDNRLLRLANEFAPGLDPPRCDRWTAGFGWKPAVLSLAFDAYHARE
jgi:hypothetical protein